jgi:hypothetical protein
MKILIFVVSIMMLTSCLYTKNAAIKKFCVPSTLDTIITIHDSVQVPISQVDTVFIQQHSDTVVVENDSVRVEYIRYRDTVYLRGIAKAKTVYITKEIPVRVTSPCPPKKEKRLIDKQLDVLTFVCVGIVLGIIFMLLYKR